MTPRQFGLLLDRNEEWRRSEDRRSGEVVAMLYNSRRDQKKDPHGITWLEVFPEWKELAPVQTEEQMLTAMFTWAKATERNRA